MLSKWISEKPHLLLGGAADYITKPFDTAELLARITVQLRKASVVSSDVITVGELRLDLTSHEVQVKTVEVHLTKTEYGLHFLSLDLGYLGVRLEKDLFS